MSLRVEAGGSSFFRQPRCFSGGGRNRRKDLVRLGIWERVGPSALVAAALLPTLITFERFEWLRKSTKLGIPEVAPVQKYDRHGKLARR